jgi:hypothetical protein
MSTVLLPCGCYLEVPDGQTLSAQALDDLILNHLAPEALKPTEDLVQLEGHPGLPPRQREQASHTR